jgi:phosphonate transport system substrate-binding protein
MAALLSRRDLFLISLAMPLLKACRQQAEPGPINKLVIGIVSYDAGPNLLDKFERFRAYLATATQTIVELEPAFNELKAVEQIQRQIWSMVFAPPGLAAIAIGSAQYIPLFGLQSRINERSVLLVQAESPIQSLSDLANQVVALGEPGSATGYYLPLYDLYGLTLQEVRFAPTPKTVLDWLNQGKIAAGAMSEQEFQQYRTEFGAERFRVLHQSRNVPASAVLIAPSVERNQQYQIEKAMREAPSSVIGDAGYIPEATLPDYDQFIKLVAKVRPLEARVKQKPAVLTMEKTAGPASPSPQESLDPVELVPIEPADESSPSPSS